MKHLRLTVVKNAAANLVRGGATAAVAIALPRFLTRSLDPERFAAWSLILQIAAYASFLDFGLQTAIARFIAQAFELEQKDRQAKLVATALSMLTGASLLAFIVISLVIWQLPHLFQGIGQGLLPEFRHAAIVLSLSACLLLPFSTYTGVLIGLHRNEIPAMAVACTRFAGAAAAITATHFTHSLTILAACIGIPNIVGGLLQMAVARRLLSEGRVRIHQISRVVGRELLRYCAGLSVWSFAMLLVSGLDLTIVGHYQFAAVGYYSIAAILISFFSGLSGAANSALIAPIATLHARNDVNRIRQVVFSTTRLTIMANLSLTIVIFLWGPVLLRLWVGPVYAASALPILKILSIAQTIRLVASPYAVMLVSVDEQRKGISGAICEALLNLTVSIFGAVVLGPIGVAWGTLIGSIGGLLWTIVLVMPSVNAVRLNGGTFLKRTVLPATIPFVPFLLLCLGANRLPPTTYVLSLLICAAAVLLGVRHYGFTGAKARA